MSKSVFSTWYLNFLVCGLGLLLISMVQNVHGQQTDRVTNLALEDGWQTVQANCTSCHSALLISQNSGSRAVWKSRIVWMQETQGLPQLGDEVENTILDYLFTNYGPKSSSRRASLPVQQMPANPYATNTN